MVHFNTGPRSASALPRPRKAAAVALAAALLLAELPSWSFAGRPALGEKSQKQGSLALAKAALNASTDGDFAGLAETSKLIKRLAAAPVASEGAGSGWADLGDTDAQEDIPSAFRMAVVRIHSIERQVDWFAPFQQNREQSAIGTGFAVMLKYNGEEIPPAAEAIENPIFITNAHVVRNAHRVQIQLPRVSQHSFDAYVPMIYEAFDLALVRLWNPAPFTAFLAKQGLAIKVMEIHPAQVSIGLDVAALGFPLGSKSLKLSRGVIAGSEVVRSHVRYQTTTPISPGSSGGPLFAAKPKDGDPFRLIGVNFAVATGQNAQNNNYVVPSVHIRQLLRYFWSKLGRFGSGPPGNASIDSPEVFNNSLARANGDRNGDHPHIIVKFAPIGGTVTIEPNEVLYSMYPKCDSGIFLSKINKHSVLAKAGVPERSFLMAVNKVEIDAYGMGRTQHFFGEPIPFQSIASIEEHIEDPITFTVCNSEGIGQFTSTMEWDECAYGLGIREVKEPTWEKDMVRFEIFAGVLVMKMTINHVVELIDDGYYSAGRWLSSEAKEKPRLIIAYLQPDTYAHRVLVEGQVVESINGINVSTLEDYAEAFQPRRMSLDDSPCEEQWPVWSLRTDLGHVLEVDFWEAYEAQKAMYLASSDYHYLMTPTFQKLFENVERNRGAAHSTSGVGAIGQQTFSEDFREKTIANMSAGTKSEHGKAHSNSSNRSDSLDLGGVQLTADRSPFFGDAEALQKVQRHPLRKVGGGSGLHHLTRAHHGFIKAAEPHHTLDAKSRSVDDTRISDHGGISEGVAHQHENIDARLHHDGDAAALHKVAQVGWHASKNFNPESDTITAQMGYEKIAKAGHSHAASHSRAHMGIDNHLERSFGFYRPPGAYRDPHDGAAGLNVSAGHVGSADMVPHAWEGKTSTLHVGQADSGKADELRGYAVAPGAAQSRGGASHSQGANAQQMRQRGKPSLQGGDFTSHSGDFLNQTVEEFLREFVGFPSESTPLARSLHNHPRRPVSYARLPLAGGSHTASFKIVHEASGGSSAGDSAA
mmetsp:Transcript_6803/g.18744  ORF Transcript_6803/g.18744 Transcript_6803/m.18744 type:complete len:1039 (-) Transcript_6803:437-3553(-)